MKAPLTGIPLQVCAWVERFGLNLADMQVHTVIMDGIIR